LQILREIEDLGLMKVIELGSDKLQELRFPDGYVSNMGRCVDMNKLKLFGMKSHDCHVFMQRLIPIAFRDLLPRNVWEPLTELSLFFKDLTSTAITEEHMRQLERNTPLILTKLGHIFPPSFWDSMEHLPIPLAYEARLAGTVQERWMYPCERKLHEVKYDIKNKNRVEVCIRNACLVKESSTLCADYFESHISTRHRKVPRNADDGGVGEDHPEMLSVFKHARGPSSGITNQFMKDLAEGPLHKREFLDEPQKQSILLLLQREFLDEPQKVKLTEGVS
ncbi:hypothetical protein MTR67_008031, partial [Solanum verrucosum]